MSLILAIDQSTSATKAVLFDGQGAVLDKAVREHRQSYPRPGWVEHDAEEIWQNVLGVIAEIAARSDLASLAGLSIANQRETVVAFDRATGRPLHQAIVWQCRRGDPLCQKLLQAGHGPLVRAKTGLSIDGYFSASKLAWLAENAAGLSLKLRSGAAVLGTVDCYLVHRLSNGTVCATDHTNASRTLLFDVRELRWDSELCDLFGVPIRALPEVRESAATFGETDACGLLPHAVPIVGVMGDSQASLFAQRCFGAGATKATFGSGTSVLMNIGSEFKLSDAGLTALAWVWRRRPTYALEGLINFSAATIAWLKNQLGLLRDESEIEALARSVPDNGGVYLVPAFSGLNAPHSAPDARGAIVGMTAFTQRAHVARAGLESIAYQFRDVLDMMRTGAAVHVDTVLADGGPSRNELLMQFTADVGNTTLLVTELADSSAWGAALNGFLGLGEFSSFEEIANLPRETREYRPHMPGADAGRLYLGWLAAVQRVL
jgi:glycerol kinase